ncbi:MAG TPA: cellulose biosynthesis cyclic di-GMP-binding regulatory protein BcsB [Anaerolineales bacterium]|nr:cellulose biosynthesis cyclic di-GMP-binding regulatory protein BcsB [Anaerolineales bacterium]
MKKLLAFVLALAIVATFIYSPPASGLAQAAATPTATLASVATGEFVPFSALGFVDELMVGPFSDMAIQFGIPNSWVLNEGTTVKLDMEVTSVTSRAEMASSEFTGATLAVYYNDYLIEVIILKKGVQSIVFDIPERAFPSTRNDGRQELNLLLDAGVDCLFPQATSVLVKASSGFVLPHTNKVPDVSLQSLPRPIYQLDSIAPEPLVIVLPSQPTAEEVEAGIVVSAAFGRMTQGLQDTSIISVDALTNDIQITSHLAFVGKPDNFPNLSFVSFRAPVVSGSISGIDVEPADGVIQMTNSPWNSGLAILYVGGLTDEAVAKAAQALSSGQIRSGLSQDLAVVKSINEATAAEVTVPVDRTFEQLGYGPETANGVGFRTLEFEFTIPYGKVAGDNPYLDLAYSYSALMDLTGSGMVLRVNDTPIGGIQLSPDTVNTVNSARIALPPAVLKPGLNILTVQTEFVPLDYCSQLNDVALWLTVHEFSSLHIPLINAPTGDVVQTQGLDQYPSQFSYEPSLNNVAFVVPTSDPQSWSVAAQIASYLGSLATGTVITPRAVFANLIPDEVRESKDMIIVGRATQLPIIGLLGDAMPSPFEAGSDLATERGLQVSYSLPAGTNVGYIQVLPAPWNTSLTVLAVMGSTPTGLTWAGDAMTTTELIAQLKGTFAVVNGTQILTADTRNGLGVDNLSATAIPGNYTATTPVPNSATTAEGAPVTQNFLLIGIVGVSVLTVLLIFAIVFMSRRKNNSRSK